MEQSEQILDTYVVWKNKKDVEKWYNMLHPDVTFDGNYVTACISIRRKIRNMDSRYITRLYIKLDMGIPGRRSNIEFLRKKILNKIINTCLSLGEDISSRVALNYSLDIIPPSSIDPLFQPHTGFFKSREFIAFLAPIMVSDNMRKFIQNGNFGPSNPLDPKSPPLNKLLMVDYNGIINQSILTMLFNIYAMVNSMGDINEYLEPTPEMIHYFSPEVLGEIKDKNPRNWFIYTRFIVVKNIKSKSNYLKEPIILGRLEKEKEVVRKIMNYYLSR